MPVLSREAVPDAAARLAEAYAKLNIVVTGGHLSRPDDFLLVAGGGGQWFAGEPIETTATHGTGCAFSSALLARVMSGDAPAEAVRAAKDYVAGAMNAAKPLGKGLGPLNHFYRF
jgi:hydroxymethylpyrimidine/phosphomethylpyrimidine kinase